MFIGAHICLLHNIINLIAVLHERAADPVQALIVLSHDDFEQLLFAFKDAFYDFLIGKRLLRQTRRFFRCRAVHNDCEVLLTIGCAKAGKVTGDVPGVNVTISQFFLLTGRVYNHYLKGEHTDEYRDSQIR